MKEIVFPAVFLVLNCAYSVVAIRPGARCNSQFGEGLCTAISQCKLLPRIKQLGHIPTMCGFDSNGPIVCCPKYSHSLQIPKSSSQKPREPEIRRPDLDFMYDMQSDQPVNNHRQSDFYNNNNNADENRPTHSGRFSEWNRDDEYPNLSTPSSSWTNNGRRKSTHDKLAFDDRPDFSTNRYPSHYEPNFRPQRRPSFEISSYETNDFRPDTSRPNSFSSNGNQHWNNNNDKDNKPYTLNGWSEGRPSFNNPSSNRPPFGNNERPNGFGSGSNFGSSNSGSTGTEDEDRPVWGFVKEKTTTSRPDTSSFQNGWSRPGKRISQIKCEEYSEIVTNNLRPLPLLPNPDVIPIPVQRCGVEAVALIVGGKDTTLGEFPHMAAIGFQGRGNVNWNCGGTLISNEYILTAAHCTHSAEGQPVRVRLGDWNLQSDDDVQHEDFRVARVIVHPQYSKTKKYNDIALLQLDRKVQFKDTIRPACLFDQDEIPVNKSIAIGWGRTETAGAKSGILQKVELSLINNRECNDLYRDMGSEASLNSGITSSMLCAGEMGGGYDTCLGDSGGPLQFTSRENRCIYNIIGITSFGKAMCGQRKSPGVYTRVSSFLPWIESKVWPEE